MSEESGADDTDHAHEHDPFARMSAVERRAALSWVGENLTDVRRSAFGQRSLYWSLAFASIVGLAADIGGYLLKSSTTTEPLSVLGDLLYTLGWALWTGAVVVVFLQVIPEAKRRQYKAALAAYEAARREEADEPNNKASPG